MNVYHGTSNDCLTDLLCTALDCICDPFNYYELTDEKKQGNPLNKHIMLLSYDAVKVRSILFEWGSRDKDAYIFKNIAYHPFLTILIKNISKKQKAGTGIEPATA